MIRQFNQHYLKENERSFLPSRFLLLDTETAQEKTGNLIKHKMKIAWTCYVYGYEVYQPLNEVWEYWEDDVELCKYIESKTQAKQVLYIFAHNAFFDLQVCRFYKYFTRHKWRVKFFYEKGLTYLLSCYNGNKKIKIISTTNYFDVALEKLGNDVGLKKLKVNFDTVTKSRLKKYCRRDVEILKRVMIMYFEFLETHDCGNFAMTRASQSMRAFRHRFMTKKICMHTEADIIDFERSAYMGGRTECFELGNIKGGPFVTLDINSMYPFVMRNYEMPTKLVDTRKNISIEYLNNIINEYCVIAHVTIKTNEPCYAIRSKNKIIFPTGYFKCYLCTAGIKYALENKHIIKIHKISIYEKDIIFKEYVDYFYDLRGEYKLQNNDIYNRYAKIFMNSLYGKFGQRISKTEYGTYDGDIEYYRGEYIDSKTGERGTETYIMNTHIVECGEEISNKSFVAIPAHITEYARLLLWKIIKQVGYNNVLYCDTDSIKIRKKDFKKVKYKVDNNELGALKIEDEYKKFIINGNKDYIQDDTIKLKGVPPRATKNKDGDYEYYTFLSHLSHMRMYEIDNFITRHTVKHLTRKYDKGIVLKNGRIIPIRFFRFPAFSFFHFLFVRLFQA